MGAIKTVAIGNRVIELHVVSGDVLESRTWTSTEVSGGGGSGYAHQGSGYSTTTPVSSTTTTHEQTFLRRSDGHEFVVELRDELRIATRPGNHVSFVLGILRGKDRGPYVAAYNHATGHASYDLKQIGELALSFNRGGCLVSFVAFFVMLFGFMFESLRSIILGLALFGGAIWVARTQSKKVEQLRSAVAAIVEGLK